MEVQMENKKKELKEIREQKKKLLELQDKTESNYRMTSNLETQLENTTKRLDIANKERDKFEKELVNTKSELAGVKRTLDLERQERRELETKALNLIKSAKKKWENAEKDKINQLNKHIESQTVRITELCTSNNEMSSRLQRIETELETANAELHKLRVFEVQYKESLNKMREINRQSAVGVENKLEQISTRAHNQIAELRTKLELETSKNIDLEGKLRNEQDSSLCRQSRLNVALELAQNELKDCHEQLRSLKATIPARDAEIETLKHQLQEKSKQLENASNMEQLVVTLQEQLDKLKIENDQLKQHLESTKSDLHETMINLEVNEALAANLERANQDKDVLEKRLKSTLQKEEEQGRKVGNLEELVRRFEKSVMKLEAENASLKTSHQQQSRASLNRRSGTSIEDTVRMSSLEQQIESLESQLKTIRENAEADRQAAKQAQLNLWKKEKELSDANLDKRIATREAKTAEEKVKKLQEEKQKLMERLNSKIKDEEDKMKKMVKELEEIKKSLSEATKDATRNKLQADSAQKALTQANKQIEELQSSSAALRREFDSTRKQLRNSQDRVDSINVEKERLSLQVSKLKEENRELESKLEKLQREENSYQVNIDLLKETCTVLEEQLNDYEKLTSNHETRENTLIQEKMKLQKDLEVVEGKLREANASLAEEKATRLFAERAIERLESEASDVEEERNGLVQQRDQYKKLTQQLGKQVAELQQNCGGLECELSETKRNLEMSKAEARIVKEECTQHLTRLHEMKEMNEHLSAELQSTVDQGQEWRSRVIELEEVLEEMRQFYQEREMKAGSTCQQQTKLIDFLQMKLEEVSTSKKKKTVCDKIFGSKQKENIPPINSNAMPVGYRELENQLECERAKVKTLTEQLLAIKATRATSPRPISNPASPEKYPVNAETLVSTQRMRHNIPHRFNVSLPMRAGKCAACLESIQFGKKAAICAECQIMAHLKCSVSVPANCGLPGGFARHLHKESSTDSLSSFGGSVQTLAIDEPDHIPERDTDCTRKPTNGEILMESWVKLPGRAKASWDRKYLRLEGSCLCTYEHQPSPGMSSISQLDLTEKDGFIICENVTQPEVPSTAKSDMPFIFRIESKSPTTCWPSSRLDIMALSQIDKKDWLKALKTYSNLSTKIEKFQTIMKLEKNQLDINTVVELEDENILLFGAEEGLFSFRVGRSRCLTIIRGVKKVYQLTLHSQLGIALMIAGEDHELVLCDLRQLKNNALAAECSRPAINTRSVLTGSESCHLYQIQGELLCAATVSQIILLRWVVTEDNGEFISVREFETQEPCGCALFTENRLIVGCHKFFKIDVNNYSIDDFPEDDNLLKTTLNGVAKLGIFPVHVLNVSNNSHKLEFLLCYNEFGVFVNESGKRTRGVDPSWSHLPFAFAYCKPYIFIVHFSSVEIIKLDANSYKSISVNPERRLIELSNPRYLGLAATRGIYVSATNSILEVLKIEGFSTLQNFSDSLTSLNTLVENDDTTSEFSFTSSLMEVLDGKKVHFASNS
ncbi:citron rho-interacting kinase-like isoform X2 [Phymastichus coffea]|nr:citron rho-interacting kinase-like isoform X2 [Phymastichus coffea]